MKHALIIGNDDRACRTIEDRLAALGFDSFERGWSEAGAVAAAGWRTPDLVVICDAVDQGCPIEAARRICEVRAVPVLMATPSRLPVRQLPRQARLRGPFPLYQLEWAVHEAGKPATAFCAT